MAGRRAGRCGPGRLFRGQRGSGGKTLRRVPDTEPAIAQPTRPPDRLIRTTADDDRDRDRRRRRDNHLVQVEKRAVEAHRATIQQLADDGQALIHPPASRRRVHPAYRDLVAVLATYPDP
jgi:hypothetical protein